jgi:hypothetical protein
MEAILLSGMGAVGVEWGQVGKLRAPDNYLFNNNLTSQYMNSMLGFFKLCMQQLLRNLYLESLIN